MDHVRSRSVPHVAALARILVQCAENIDAAIERDDFDHPLFPVSKHALEQIDRWQLHAVYSAEIARGWGVGFFAVRPTDGQADAVDLVLLAIETEDVVGFNLGGAAYLAALSRARDRLRNYP